MFDIYSCLTISGIFNSFIGLKLCFSSPPEHLQLQRHPRYDYLSYVFAGHGFLILMIGISELYPVYFITNQPGRDIFCNYIAKIVSFGDFYVFLNAVYYRFIKKSNVHPDEIEFSYFSMGYCLLEASSLLYLSMFKK